MEKLWNIDKKFKVMEKLKNHYKFLGLECKQSFFKLICFKNIIMFRLFVY